MRKTVTFFISLILTLVVLTPIGTSYAVSDAKNNNPESKKDYIPNQIIIKFKSTTPSEVLKKNYKLKNVSKILQKHNLSKNVKKSAEAKGLDRLFLAETDEKDIQTLARLLSHEKEVEYAEPNYILRASITPNDPQFSSLWGLSNSGQTAGKVDGDIDAPEAWDSLKTSNITVGVIDTGVDYNHQDLKDNIWSNPLEATGSAGIDDDNNGFVDDIYGYDFANNDGDPMDDYGHGTHVAGTIGAKGDNGIGVTGVNWSGKIASIKFLNSSGSGSLDGAVQSVVYANMMGFKITSNSWGGGGFYQSLFDAISSAYDQGNLFIAAAGNNGSNNDLLFTYPASYNLENIISVAATDHNDLLASFSNFGATTVDIGAPGVNILSTVPTATCPLCDPSGYMYLSGTSMATPHVSGAAALYWSQNPSLTNLEIKNKLLNTSDQVDSLVSKTQSGGRLNIYNMVENDSSSPAAISDLGSDQKTISSVRLTWTAVGDDGNTGQAARYDIRYSKNPIDSTNFNQATRVSNTPIPTASGTSQNVTINDLLDQTTYFFAIETVDNVGNTSDISNTIAVTTEKATVFFADDFEASASGWVIEGTTGDASASGVLWHQSEKRSSSPTHSFYYGKEDTSSFNTGFANRGTITSLPVDISNAASITLQFKHFLSTENLSQSQVPYYDQAKVLMSFDNGLNWNQLLLKGSTEGIWVSENLPIAAPVGTTSMLIRFSFDSVDSILNDYEGWFVDDIKVLGSSYQNTAPIADPGGPYTFLEDQEVTLDGSGSTDGDGDPITGYLWNFGDQGENNFTFTQAPTIVHTYSKGGDYTATLRVQDAKTNSQPVSTPVHVTEVNDPPIANAGGPYTGSEGETIAFDGSNSSDEESSNLSYKWNFGDGQTATTSSPLVSHLYSQGGQFTLTLIVNDGTVDSIEASLPVTVTEVNDAPVASAGPDQNGFVSSQFNFSAASSTDEEGPLSYNWNFGDSQSATGVNTSHTFTSAGTFTVTLVVTDAGGLTSTDTLTVTTIKDTVTITSATYSNSKKQLIVNAKSNSEGRAILSVTNFGLMTYNPQSLLYNLSKNNVSIRPTSVTVTSSFGGSATSAVTKIK